MRPVCRVDPSSSASSSVGGDPAHQPRHPWGVAVYQSQGVIQGEAALRLQITRAVVIVALQFHCSEERFDHLGAIAIALFAFERPVVGHRKGGILQQPLHERPGILLHRRAQPKLEPFHVAAAVLSQALGG